MSDIVKVEITKEDNIVNVEINKNVASTFWGGINGDIDNQTDLNTKFDTKEDQLGNPATDGYILSSTIAGVRSWISKTVSLAFSAITGSPYDNTSLASALNAKKDTFTENTGFNKDLGTIIGTVSEGDHTHTTFGTMDFTGEVDHNDNDIVGVKDLEVTGSGTFGNQSEASLICFDMERSWCFQSTGVGGSNRLELVSSSANKEFKILANVSGEFVGIREGKITATTGARFEGAVEILGTTDHKNQDVTNIKDIDFATMKSTGLTADPAVNNGKIYYNTTLEKFRACENGAWTNLI